MASLTEGRKRKNISWRLQNLLIILPKIHFPTKMQDAQTKKARSGTCIWTPLTGVVEKLQVWGFAR